MENDILEVLIAAFGFGEVADGISLSHLVKGKEIQLVLLLRMFQSLK
ncbi:hypothetical protein [Ferdinandcohnia sp. SAFN-114]